MIKSLARAKFEAPILSELSTMKARSKGSHLHSENTVEKTKKTSQTDYDISSSTVLITGENLPQHAAMVIRENMWGEKNSS